MTESIVYTCKAHKAECRGLDQILTHLHYAHALLEVYFCLRCLHPLYRHDHEEIPTYCEDCDGDDF